MSTLRCPRGTRGVMAKRPSTLGSIIQSQFGSVKAGHERGYNHMRRSGDGALAVIERMRSTARWHRVRDMARRRDPLCVLCLESGRTTPTDDIDHIVPARVLVEQGTPDMFFDLAGVRGLCRGCHAREGAK